jgi:hypothetical protein
MCGCPAPCLKYQHVLYMVWSLTVKLQLIERSWRKQHDSFRNYEANMRCVAVLRPVSSISTPHLCFFSFPLCQRPRPDWDGLFQSLWIAGGCLADLRHLDCPHTVHMSWGQSSAALELKHQQRHVLLEKCFLRVRCAAVLLQSNFQQARCMFLLFSASPKSKMKPRWLVPKSRATARCACAVHLSIPIVKKATYLLDVPASEVCFSKDVTTVSTWSFLK